MTKTSLQGREVIFEFAQIGQIVKVTAMDTKSLTEISIQGPISTPQNILQQNALKRLQYVLNKKGIVS